MNTRHFSVNELGSAAQLLRDGEVVAFPTETVYGLGADALNADAIRKIFSAKGRPSDNPLIVHIADPNQLTMVARDVPIVAKSMMEQLWPGPLTIILPKRSEIPQIVTANLDTVAVRLPNHRMAIEIIRLAGVPLAAPSANRSGRPSATTWQAVAEDLDGRIAGLVCGEPTTFGLESTVVDTTSNPPRVLRPGAVSFEQLQEVCPAMQPYTGHSSPLRGFEVSSPGLKHKHYQPTAKVIIVDTSSAQFELAIPDSAVVHFIGLSKPVDPTRFQKVLVCANVSEYAAKLFDFFRKADLSNADVVCCQEVIEIGIGVALMDRIRRASQ